MYIVHVINDLRFEKFLLFCHSWLCMFMNFFTHINLLNSKQHILFITVSNGISHSYCIYTLKLFWFSFFRTSLWFKNETNRRSALYIYRKHLNARNKEFMIIQLLSLKHSCLSYLSQLMCSHFHIHSGKDWILFLFHGCGSECWISWYKTKIL